MIKDFLTDHAAGKPVSFHMPGHKGSGIYLRCGYGDVLDRLIDMDITEIPGADNLFRAEGPIRELQEHYAAMYGAGRSFLLVNGSSGGIIASVLTAVKRGGSLIMTRNCHRSVFNALYLGDISPVYLPSGTSGTVRAGDVAGCMDEHPRAEAVIITSPDYYGRCSDIEAIAREVHSRGKMLIVDQAHGAHLKFFSEYGCGKGMPAAAEDSGADLVIDSIHKTLASFTQSALLNVMSDRVDERILEDRLQMMQSSSPSYILMASLDMNREIIERHGRELFPAWRENLDRFRDRASRLPGLRIYGGEGTDLTRIVLSVDGLEGSALETMMNVRGIYPELHAGDKVMFMTGIGNVREHYDRLLEALEEISAGSVTAREQVGRNPGVPAPGRLHAVPAEEEEVPLRESAGRICARPVVPYPPGIPVICPGEEVTAEMSAYIEELLKRGEKVTGITPDGKMFCGK